MGKSEAMLYAGHENHAMDSMMVSVVITPVNDAPVASFNMSKIKRVAVNLISLTLQMMHVTLKELLFNMNGILGMEQ